MAGATKFYPHTFLHVVKDKFHIHFTYSDVKIT